MNLHEYQGKEILNSFGVKIQRGIVAKNHKEAVDAAKQLTVETGTSWYVVKAQVHAGGRGKVGGVEFAINLFLTLITLSTDSLMVFFISDSSLTRSANDLSSDLNPSISDLVRIFIGIMAMSVPASNVFKVASTGVKKSAIPAISSASVIISPL